MILHSHNIIIYKMGQEISSTNNFNFPEYVLSHQEFNDLIQNEKKNFHNYMAKKNKYAVIYICDKETDEDRLDEAYIENCEIDSICADYVNRYYVAQLKTSRQGYYSDFTSVLQDNYHTIWSYGFDIYEYHKVNKDYKRLIVKDYYFCDIKERTKNLGTHISNDLLTILQIIKSLNRDLIEEKIMAIITEKSRLREIDKINKQYL